MDLSHLPIVILFLSAATAGLTQVIKVLGETATSMTWKAIAAQITAAVIASILALPAVLHLTLSAGLAQIFTQVVSQLGPVLTVLLVSAGSYAAHDLAGIAQALKDRLKAGT